MECCDSCIWHEDCKEDVGFCEKRGIYTEPMEVCVDYEPVWPAKIRRYAKEHKKEKQLR